MLVAMKQVWLLMAQNTGYGHDKTVSLHISHAPITEVLNQLKNTFLKAYPTVL